MMSLPIHVLQRCRRGFAGMLRGVQLLSGGWDERAYGLQRLGAVAGAALHDAPGAGGYSEKTLHDVQRGGALRADGLRDVQGGAGGFLGAMHGVQASLGLFFRALQDAQDDFRLSEMTM